MGSFTLDKISLETISNYIDWSPLFHAWELSGVYPKIFEHPTKGKEAKRVFNDAQNLLKSIIKDDRLDAKAVYGIFRAQSHHEDIELFEEGVHLFIFPGN